MIAAEKPSIAAAVPTIWTGLLDYLDQHKTDVSSLHEVVVGGSACPPALEWRPSRSGTASASSTRGA
ncbi:hypothetical protein ACU686_23290 [Yinghuangia aomiensis]